MPAGKIDSAKIRKRSAASHIDDYFEDDYYDDFDFDAPDMDQEDETTTEY